MSTYDHRVFSSPRLRSGQVFLLLVVAMITTMAGEAQAYIDNNRLTIDVSLSGDWVGDQTYEAATWNNGFPDHFSISDSGMDQALAEYTATRQRPFIDPWPFPNIDPTYVPTEVAIGRSFATGTYLQVSSDALGGYGDYDTYYEQDIEGYARILNLVPTSDQSIEVSIDVEFVFERSILYARLGMTDQTAGTQDNLLPNDLANVYPVFFNTNPNPATLTTTIDVLAGHSYTFNVFYDNYSGFVPEPASLLLLGFGSVVLMRRA